MKTRRQQQPDRQLKEQWITVGAVFVMIKKNSKWMFHNSMAENLFKKGKNKNVTCWFHSRLVVVHLCVHGFSSSPDDCSRGREMEEN